MVPVVPAEENHFSTKGESLTTHYALNTIHQTLFLLKKSLQSHIQIELTLKDEIEQIGLEIKNLQTIVHLIDDSTKQILSLLLNNKTTNISTTNNETIVHLLQNLTQTIQTCIPKISLKTCHICESMAYKSKQIKVNTKKLHIIKVMTSAMQKQTHMLIINHLKKKSNAYAQISHTIEKLLNIISYCCKELSQANVCSIEKIKCIAEQLNMMTKTLNKHDVNF